MPRDPNAAALLRQTAGFALHRMSVVEARQRATFLAAVQGDAPAMAKVENQRIPGPAGHIPIRTYTPEGPPPLPAVVYFHGGGWVMCDLDTHDAACRMLAEAVPAVVVSVDYRLAPEHRFPAAAEDAYAATRWVAEHAATLRSDERRLAVAGDSSGGNLAAVVALMARDRHGPSIAHQVLVYPMIDGNVETRSSTDEVDEYLLSRDTIAWFWNHYVHAEDDRRHPYASPMAASDLQGLPPATIVTAELDLLREECDAYAARLRDAGVPVRSIRYDGLPHGFLTMGAIFSQAKEAFHAIAADLQQTFGKHS